MGARARGRRSAGGGVGEIGAAAIDAGLQADVELAPPPYEDRPSRYYFYDVPEDLDVAAIVDGWDG